MPSAGADAEETEHSPPPERQDGVGGRELHRTDGGAVGLPVTARQYVLGEHRLAALGVGAVAAVALEREDAIQRRGPGEARVVTDHGAGRHAHAAADALDRGVDRALDSETAAKATERLLKTDTANRVWEKVLESDHYGLEKIKERILEFLAVRALARR